jgi:hypothetical protein
MTTETLVVLASGDGTRRTGYTTRSGEGFRGWKVKFGLVHGVCVHRRWERVVGPSRLCFRKSDGGGVRVGYGWPGVCWRGCVLARVWVCVSAGMGVC